MAEKSYLISMADLHSGHRLGLLRPGVELRDVDPKTGGLMRIVHPLEPFQRDLWELYEMWLARASEITAGAPLDLLVDGDVAQGLVHGEHSIAGGLCREHQIAIAVANIGRAVEILEPRRIFIAQGSRVHSDNGTIEAWTAYYLQTETGIPTRAIYHGLINVGIQVDAAHKGPSKGYREWLEGNQARLYLRDRMKREIARDRKPPELYCRAHFHVYRRELVDATWRGQTVTSQIVLIPALCGMAPYAREKTLAAPYVTIGIVIQEVEGGRLKDVQDLKEDLDFREKL